MTWKLKASTDELETDPFSKNSKDYLKKSSDVPDCQRANVNPVSYR